MKKLALLIVLMMVFALTSYAADIAVTVTGKSELVFGINLDDPLAGGFTNTNESKITFDLVTGTSEKGKAEDGAVYGYIKISGWKINLDGAVTWAGKNGDVEAKIIFPSGWVKISGTNADLNYVLAVQDDDGDNDNADKGLSDAIPKSGGLVLGLNFAPIAVELGIFTENEWTEATETPAVDDLNDEFAVGVNLKVTADFTVIKIEAGVETGLNYVTSTGLGLGGKVSLNMAPLTAYVALDMTYDSAVVATVDVTGVGLELGFGAALDVAGIKVSADGSLNQLTATVGTVEAVGSTEGLDIRTKIDAGGLVTGLGLALTVELFNLLPTPVTSVHTTISATNTQDLDTAAEYAIIFDVSYQIATIKPYASVRYATYTWDNDHDSYVYSATGDDILALSIGAELSMIPNVLFTLVYNSPDLMGTATATNGTFQIKTKIAY